MLSHVAQSGPPKARDTQTLRHPKRHLLAVGGMSVEGVALGVSASQWMMVHAASEGAHL